MLIGKSIPCSGSCCFSFSLCPIPYKHKVNVSLNISILPYHCCKISLQYSAVHWVRKEGNVLFNDALNTFYLRLYGVGHMVKDHSDSERGNLLPQHGLLFSISSKGSFICTIPQTGYHIPRSLLHIVEHWLEREIAKWVHHEGSIRRPITPYNLMDIYIKASTVVTFK